MKKAISVILTLAYLTGVLQFTVPFLSYYSNYTYFATEACINRHNPEVECNGQCQLKKMVDQQHDHESSAPDNAVQVEKISSSTIFFYEGPFSSDFYVKASIFFHHPFTNLSSQLYSRPPTPPPQFG